MDYKRNSEVKENKEVKETANAESQIDRKQYIEDLKAYRAELLKYKETQESGGSDDDSVNSYGAKVKRLEYNNDQQKSRSR